MKHKSEVRAFAESLWFITEGLAYIKGEYLGVGNYAGWTTIDIRFVKADRRMNVCSYMGRFYIEVFPAENGGRQGFNTSRPIDPETGM